MSFIYVENTKNKQHQKLEKFLLANFTSGDVVDIGHVHIYNFKSLFFVLGFIEGGIF